MASKYRVFAPLERDEAIVLYTLAKAECRDPRAQLRYMFRCEAERRGLLKPEGDMPEGGDASSASGSQQGAANAN